MVVLCIDNDPISLKMLTRMVERTGIAQETYVTASAEEARDLLGKVDIIFTELILPEISGLDLIEEAKAVNPSVEIIVVTGHSSIETAVEAIRRGARNYVAKPLKAEFVQETLITVSVVIMARREANNIRPARDVPEKDETQTLLWALQIRVNQQDKHLHEIKMAIAEEGSTEDKLAAIIQILADA